MQHRLGLLRTRDLRDTSPAVLGEELGSERDGTEFRKVTGLYPERKRELPFSHLTSPRLR